MLNRCDFRCVLKVEYVREGAMSTNMRLVHWPLMGGLLHLVQRRGDWVGPHPSMASVPVTVLLYNGLLLCSFNVPITGNFHLHSVFLGYLLSDVIEITTFDN